MDFIVSISLCMSSFRGKTAYTCISLDITNVGPTFEVIVIVVISVHWEQNSESISKYVHVFHCLNANGSCRTSLTCF